ncbi:MAG: asparagine synthase (glutamine-hydrolyzing) [Alphaproteobacteria bacterium]
MCGIVAIFGHGAGAPPVAPAELRTIRDAMAARGPDDAGEWFGGDGAIALGSRRLAIIDPSPAGHQPMISADGGLVVALNGEIYNHQALRDELVQAGVAFRTRSDTEVLLALYRRDGPAMVERLRGMYAIALWDEARQGLLLARDPLGIKPLYLADDGRTLRAASQVKALIAGGAIDPAPEPAGHAGFLLWGYVPEPFTLHRSITALPAGAVRWIGRSGHTTDAGRFDLAGELRAARAGPLPDLAGALADSVRHHHVSDVPVGMFLSAGIDSSAIVALSREGAPSDRLITLTLGFVDAAGQVDETAIAAATARRYGTEHHERRFGRADFKGRLERMLAAMDQPTVDGINTYLVSAVARECGLKVALSGLGGDELFGGYPSFRHVPAAARWLRPFGVLPGLGRGFRRLAAPLCRRLGSPKWASLLEYGGGWSGAYLLRRGLFMPWELPELIGPDLARAGWERLQPLARLDETIAGVEGDRPRVAALELAWYMRGQLLRDADWAGMAHSIEIRTPLVDRDLFRAVARHWAAGRAPGKADLAAAPAAPLPAAVLDRPKTGFAVPVRAWLAGEAAGRGLRGWAAMVYRAAVGSALTRPAPAG